MTLLLILAMLAGPQDISPALKKKLDVARAALEKAPEDPKANLDLGKLLCFDLGEWAEGLPLLAKGGDKELAPLAQRDLDTTADRLPVADAWFTLSKKAKAPGAQARALTIYGEAWKATDAGMVKDHIRAKLLAIQGKGATSKTLGAFPSGWSNPGTPRCRAGVDREFARSGQCSVKILAPDPKVKEIQSWLGSDRLPCKAGAKITFTCWALTVGSDGDNLIYVKFRNDNQKVGEFISRLSAKADPDMPIWTKIEGEGVVPDGATNLEIAFNRHNTKAGVVFLDDFSLKADGQELLKNGGFEQP